MLTLHKRHDRTIPGDGAGRSARATAVSVIVHIVLLFALVQALQSTGAIQRASMSRSITWGVVVM